MNGFHHYSSLVLQLLTRRGCLSLDHGKNHLEPFDGIEGMRYISRHDQHLARMDLEDFAADMNLGFAVHNLDDCIKRSSVFTQLLALIEGKESDVSGRIECQLLADDAAGRILHAVCYIRSLSHHGSSQHH